MTDFLIVPRTALQHMLYQCNLCFSRHSSSTIRGLVVLPGLPGLALASCIRRLSPWSPRTQAAVTMTGSLVEPFLAT